MKKNHNFVDAFNWLGENCSNDTNNTVIATLEKYTCAIYMVIHGRRQWMLSELNSLKRYIYIYIYIKEGKVIDMSLLAPWNSVLLLHIKRANHVAQMWKSSLTNWFDSDDISENGWFPNGSTYQHIGQMIFSHMMLRRYWLTLHLSMMILKNLMSKTSCQLMKIITMTMMSENIDTDCFQYSFKWLN